jgi:putative transposase
MARLPRLVVPGQLHWLIQSVHGGVDAFVDEADHQHYLQALHEATRNERVHLHAYALTARAVHLLVTPEGATSLARVMQSQGRRFVSNHHRRHGGHGTLWDGRYRCAPVEPGATALDVLCLIDGMGEGPLQSSQIQRSAGVQLAGVIDPPEYWQLGNTPFDRQAAWRARLAEGLSSGRTQALLQAVMGGWVVGSKGFAGQLAGSHGRPVAPRPRGRPRRSAS